MNPFTSQFRKNVNQKLQEILNHMSDINTRLTGIEGKLDEASTEIVAELKKLRDQLGNVITPEADATITRIEGKATALADIIAPEPPPTTT